MKNYTESALIELPAIDIFQLLGYEYSDCFHERYGEKGTLGRETPSDVVLVPRLKLALFRLNPNLKPEAVTLVIEELTRDRSSLNPVVAHSEMYKRRADLVGFINGWPLIFIELKATHKRLENAHRNNLTDYKDTIPQIFWYNAFAILSNGSESRIGTITADYDHFSEWKKINSEGEEGIVSLDTIIRGTCEKYKFLDILENFILFQDKGKGSSYIKLIAKNHQYLGVNNAIESFKDIKENQGKLGVFWHTQGSGKSFSMLFFSQKILRRFKGDY